jgi:hypothetical protein
LKKWLVDALVKRGDLEDMLLAYPTFPMKDTGLVVIMRKKKDSI